MMSKVPTTTGPGASVRTGTETPLARSAGGGCPWATLTATAPASSPALSAGGPIHLSRLVRRPGGGATPSFSPPGPPDRAPPRPDPPATPRPGHPAPRAAPRRAPRGARLRGGPRRRAPPGRWATTREAPPRRVGARAPPGAPARRAAGRRPSARGTAGQRPARRAGRRTPARRTGHRTPDRRT